ncbi:MAG: hypothetical protein OXE50_12580 [Chloroflexi bacterium]|nr:hypothetical protein [Chloroflexota bacterium]
MTTRVRGAWEALHYPIVMLVFAVNGALAAALGHVLLNDFIGIEGSLWAGPWGYRVLYVALITPSYSLLLLVTSALFGKGAYFRTRLRRTWGRLLPVPWLRG